MILPTHVPSRHRRPDRPRPGRPAWGSAVVGIGGFLFVAAACLYLIALAGK